MKYLSIAFYTGMVLISACALSPQVISISPELDVAEEKHQQYSNMITITVTDSRDSRILGSRGGIYRDTALLSTADDMTARLKDILNTAFSSMGYNVYGGDGPNRLTIDISELNYRAERRGTVTAVSTSAAVNVRCQNDMRTVTNTYRVTDSKEFITAPTARQNQQAINATLETALNRMFNDDNLLNCLDN